MRLKSYFAATVEAALKLARHELGPDAMLVDSRRTGIESRHLGEYEVVCALIAGKFPDDPAPSGGPGPGFRAPSLDKLSQEVSELKRYMERMAGAIARSSAGFANLRSNPELAEAFASLTASEVDSTLAHDIVARIGGHLTDSSQIPQLIRAELENLIATDSRLGKPAARQRIVALVGPPGSGKTTCLVKLAAHYGLAARKPTQILTLDTFRVAAADQMRSFAAILGVGFQVAETPAALAQLLEEHRQKDLILIDTPGFGKHDLADAEEIAKFLVTHPGIDKHLVLPASMKWSDMRRISDDYQMFRPDKLLFTRVDETATFGPILNLTIRTGKPASFLCSGQQIPEDLEPASKEALLTLLLRKDCLEEHLNSAVAAA